MMLNRYAILNNADLDVSRAAHASQSLRLEPFRVSEARECTTTANAFESPDFLLHYFSYARDVTLTAGADNPDYWVALPIETRSVGRRSRITLRNDAGRLASPSRDDPLMLRGHSQTLGLCLRRHTLQRFADPYFGEDKVRPIIFDPKFDITRSAFRVIGETVIMLMQEEAKNSSVLLDKRRVASFLDAMISTLLFYCPHSHTAFLARPNHAPSPNDVKRVMDYVRAYSDSDITLAKLVAVAGVPGRTLNEHFRAFTGVSPMAYLKIARLRNARAHLENETAASVTDAAMRAGLSHLGRFAQDYRDRFGELPSETFRRRRRH